MQNKDNEPASPVGDPVEELSELEQCENELWQHADGQHDMRRLMLEGSCA